MKKKKDAHLKPLRARVETYYRLKAYAAHIDVPLWVAVDRLLNEALKLHPEAPEPELPGKHEPKARFGTCHPDSIKIVETEGQAKLVNVEVQVDYEEPPQHMTF